MRRGFQGVVRFAFIQSDLRTALHVGIEQPINDKERLLDPSDFS